MIIYITGLAVRAEVWFKWVKRSWNLIPKTTFSKKMVDWLVLILQEASKNFGTDTIRWKPYKILT